MDDFDESRASALRLKALDLLEVAGGEPAGEKRPPVEPGALCTRQHADSVVAVYHTQPLGS